MRNKIIGVKNELKNEKIKIEQIKKEKNDLNLNLKKGKIILLIFS